MCRPHYTHLLRPTYSKNHLLIAFGNAQHRQIKKHDRYRLCDWGRGNKEVVEQREIFPAVLGRVNPSPLSSHMQAHTLDNNSNNLSSCHLQIIVIIDVVVTSDKCNLDNI